MPLPPSGGWPISPEEAAWHTEARAVRGANPQDCPVKPPPPQVAPAAPAEPAVANHCPPCPPFSLGFGECPRRWTCGWGSALGEIAGASRGSYGCCAPPAASAREAGSPRRRHARSCSGCGRRRDGGRGAGPEQRHDGGPGAAVHSGRGPAHGQCCWLLVVPTAAARVSARITTNKQQTQHI